MVEAEGAHRALGEGQEVLVEKKGRKEGKAVLAETRNLKKRKVLEESGVVVGWEDLGVGAGCCCISLSHLHQRQQKELRKLENLQGKKVLGIVTLPPLPGRPLHEFLSKHQLVVSENENERSFD